MANHLRVLHVEDDENEVVLLRRELRQGGYEPEIHHVETEDAMRQALTEKTWDIVIADFSLPSFNGLDALRVCRESEPDLPFIMFSGTIGEATAVIAMKAGANDIIMKDQKSRLLPALERELRDAGERTARRRAEAELSHQAMHDPLTGLYNRRAFEHRLQSCLAEAHQFDTQHVLCMLDLDQFKVINDTCGHVAGDEMLRQISAVLGATVRNGDTLARLGGDEFGILLNACPIEEASRVTSALLDALQGFRFVSDDKVFGIGGSIGMVVINADTENAQTLLSNADNACYLAKEKGRGRAQIYKPDDQELIARHREMQWVARLGEALEQDRFVLYQQPIVTIDANGTQVHHWEILVRMRERDGEVVLPGVFIPAAERYNLMRNIDRCVVGKVIAWLQQRRDQGLALPHLMVNLSGVSLSDESFLEQLVAQMREMPVLARQICFEITETSAIRHLAATIHFIHELKHLGLQFALDDFGSGAASFTYLRTLPVDYIKIDGHFVKDIATDAFDHAIVEAIHRIAQTANLKTIAEFVESDQVLAHVRAIGIDYAQGYAIARPAPLDDLIFQPSPATDRTAMPTP
jgi:diguanylate cyclase (GGDEF)-like protein